jgi:hypothetical protein
MFLFIQHTVIDLLYNMKKTNIVKKIFIIILKVIFLDHQVIVLCIDAANALTFIICICAL